MQLPNPHAVLAGDGTAKRVGRRANPFEEQPWAAGPVKPLVPGDTTNDHGSACVVLAEATRRKTEVKRAYTSYG